MKKVKRSVKIVIAVALVIVLFLSSGVIFYLSKLNLIKFSNGKFRWNGSIDTNAKALKEFIYGVKSE